MRAWPPAGYGGIEASETYFLALLAEGYGRSEQPAEGLKILAEALAAVDQSGARFYEAELYRLKGDLLLVQTSTGHAVQEAEVCFRQALAVARRQQAKWLELRAAISLSRLWQQQGKRAQPTICWRRSTAGSRRGLRRQTSGRHRHCLQSWRDRVGNKSDTLGSNPTSERRLVVKT